MSSSVENPVLLEEKPVLLIRHYYYLSSLGYKKTTCFTHTSPWSLDLLIQALKDSVFYSHITMVTCLYPHIKGQPVSLIRHHGYQTIKGQPASLTCYPWLSVLIWASKDNLFCPHVTMDTCPHLGIKGQPIVFSISPWLPALTWTTRCFLHITMVTCPHLDYPLFSPYHHGYLSSPGHQRTTRLFLHITMVTCPHLGIKGKPGHRDVLGSSVDIKVFTARVGQHVAAVVALETVDETGCQDTSQVRIFAVRFLCNHRHSIVVCFTEPCREKKTTTIYNQ